MASQPTTIGRYEIQERIAHGGMGVLYRAFDPATDRSIALKLLRVDSADLRERFLREARLAARLQHPNIVTVYDVGAHEGQPFIAMEFIRGETLAQIIRRRAPLPLSRRIALIEQVCVGLAYAHRHGIVHQDVKPANLMVSEDSGVLKVLDFGIAGHVNADPRPDGRMLMGTPNYMSPEQVVGQPVDYRSDVFSVGLVLYEIVAYKQAFSGESQQAILLKVLNESPEPLSLLVPGLDKMLPAIVDRALQKSVDQRFPDLDALRSDLSRVGQRLAIAERSADVTGRGTPAARGRGRAREVRYVSPLEPVIVPAPAVPPVAPPAPPAGLEPPEAAAPAAQPAPAATQSGSVADALAAAERDAYEGRLSAAIRRLEGVPQPDEDVRAALARYREDLEARKRRPADADQGGGGALAAEVRSHVGSVRTAMDDGRWHEAADLLRALEQRLPRADVSDLASPPQAAQAELRRDDEVAHFLARARQRLDSGDIAAAQALLEAALEVTRTP